MNAGPRPRTITFPNQSRGSEMTGLRSRRGSSWPQLLSSLDLEPHHSKEGGLEALEKLIQR